MQKITFVKKKLENGEWCAKCNDVSSRLEKDGLLKYIDEVLVADVRDPNSEGKILADEYNVDRAPFFIVKDIDTKTVEIFDVYFKFKRHLERTSKLQAA